MNDENLDINNMIHEILALTQEKDGFALAPQDRYLVDFAEREYLNEKGKKAIVKLHEKITGKTYLPWFHGIEHLTIHNNGDVFWKTRMVEQLQLSWAYTESAKKYAGEIARRCRLLEAHHKPCNIRTVVVEWKEPNAMFVRKKDPS